MLKRFLSRDEEELVQAERLQVLGLRTPLESLDVADDDLNALERSLLNLDELFLLVIVGEFNAGKSAFINALLGERFLTEGVTPTTAQIHLIRHGELAAFGVEDAGARGLDREIVVATYPVDWLRDINIVDTPGTNTVILEHERITNDFVPRADLVLFVTSADRPFTESERQFIERIRDWGKKVVFVVNKIDIHEEAEAASVLRFVAEHARQLLGREPVVYGVSSRQALKAKEATDEGERERLWSASHFAPLEGYILETLDEKERLRLKLANPLGVAQRLTDKYLAVAANRRELLKDDVATLASIDDQLAAHEDDLRRNFKYHLSHVDNVLLGITQRGDDFFDETIRLQRVFDLINADRIRGQFERQVIADAPQEVEAQTRDLIDWLVDLDYRQWQGVTELLNRRLARHEDKIIGQVGGTFEVDRKKLIESVGKTARDVVAGYNHTAEARLLGESVQHAVAHTALVGAGAIGLGAVLVHVLASTLLDVTGVLAAIGVGALGFYIIPRKRTRAKADLQTKIDELREKLDEALTGQLEKELQRSMINIREAMRPYTRFVETQRSSLDDTERMLLEAKDTLARLASRVEAL